MIWISFGEVKSTFEPMKYSKSPEMGTMIHLVWILFTNVLLLNLLISMMAETFRSDTADTHSAVSFMYVCMYVCMYVRWLYVCRCVCMCVWFT